MESRDLRLLLGVAEGIGTRALSEALGSSEVTVRRRLRRMVGPTGPGWLRHSESGGYEVADLGQDAVGLAKQAVTSLDHIAASLGVDEVLLSHVELVMAVVAAGSIGGAARGLRLPQSSVSAKVSRVEERWRTTLFVRDQTGVRPTAALADLLPRIALVEQAATRLRGRPDRPRCAPPSPHGLEMAIEVGFSGLLEALVADGLDVSQHVIEIPGREWTPTMRQADICLYLDLPMASLPVPAGHETAIAFCDPLYAVVPARVAAGRRRIGLGELAGQDWLTGAIGGRNHSSVVALCRSAGFDPRVKYTSTHSRSARHVLNAEVAVALTSAAFVPGTTAPTVRLAEDFEVRVTVGWRRGGTLADVAHRIVGWLRLAHSRRLAASRPELLAEMRADPDRWPHLTGT
ncbi:LysR family transcriptional regulator [Actinokineospora guangxiensis]|uniref:LysR family transcriptional regulator n=1 Tax=Actinokineospora guangxiensis TaxID=1490288 RepID=A0ABW0EYH6_9PSEU